MTSPSCPRDYTDATLEYAVGDDLVVSGVVYDRELWERDGEGGVRPRARVDHTNTITDTSGER